MSTSLDTVLQAALELPEEDRARLAASLLGSLESADEASVEEAWAAEIARRSREYDEGNVTPIPWSQVRESVRKQFTSHG